MHRGFEQRDVVAGTANHSNNALSDLDRLGKRILQGIIPSELERRKRLLLLVRDHSRAKRVVQVQS